MSVNCCPILAVAASSLLAFLAACRGAGAPPAERWAAVPPPPPTRTVDAVDDYHGIEVADPYRWLEDVDSDEVSRWVDLQNARTEAFLDAVPERAAIRSRLTELWTYPKWTAPERHGPWWFWRRNDGLQNQAVLMRGTMPGADGVVLLDPNTLSDDGTVSLGPTAFSEDGAYLAYATSTSGSDWMEWHVLEVATARPLDDRLEWSKFAGASWTHDGKGFFYQRYPAPKDGEVYEAVTQSPKLCYHVVGMPQRDDRVVYERPDQPQWSFGARVTDDGRYAFVSIHEGTDRKSRVAWIDLQEKDWPVRPFLMDFDAGYSFVGVVDGKALLVTDRDAPNRRIVGVPIASPAPDAKEWKVVVPEAAQAIEGAVLVGDAIVVTYLRDASHQLQRFSTTGDPLGAIQLPELGTVGPLTGRREDRVTYFTFETFTRPPEVHGFDFDAGKEVVLMRPALHYDPDVFRVRQVGFESSDGTPLRMFLVYRKELELDADNPAMLYGYGGFDISLTPKFSAENLVFCERGGIYAQATLRGGGEYGRAWHEAGMREHKQNVFDDFVAAARYLIRNDFTAPARLAIHGRSNGGLLVGAVLTQHPELFGAAIPDVGVMDMLRYHRFTIGWAWEPEYGSSEDPKMFAVLRAYSPLQNVKPDTRYPPTLITTGDHDDRVLPGHSYKFAAALQAAQVGPGPILLRVDRSAGHGPGKPTRFQIAEAADRLTFLAATIGG